MSERAEFSLLTTWENTLKALFGGIRAIFPSGAIPLCIKNSIFIELEKVVSFVPVC